MAYMNMGSNPQRSAPGKQASPAGGGSNSGGNSAPSWSGQDNDDATIQKPLQNAPAAQAAPPIPSANVANPPAPQTGNAIAPSITSGTNVNQAGSQMGSATASAPANPNASGPSPLIAALLGRMGGGTPTPNALPQTGLLASLIARLRGGQPMTTPGANPNVPQASATPYNPIRA